MLSENENEICLWCQDSLSDERPVIELTTEDFKLVFKHDATCKKIHWACFQDYQQKRANHLPEHGRAQANEHEFQDQRSGAHIRVREPRLFVRFLLHYFGPANQNIHIGMRNVQSTTIWSNLPSIARTYVQMSQTFPVSTQFAHQSISAQPLQHPTNAPAHFSRAMQAQHLHHLPVLPTNFSSQSLHPFVPLFLPQGVPLQSTINLQNTFNLQNSFTPYANVNFPGSIGTTHMGGNHRPVQVQRNVYPNVHSLTCQASSAGTYGSGVSVVTHTYSSAVYQ